jgi:hypothetical protein
MNLPVVPDPPPAEAGPPRAAPLPPLSTGKIVTGVIVVAVLTAAAIVALWWAATRGLTGADLITARLDALKVGLSIGVASGGLFALYLTWRRQRATETGLTHQLQVAADTKAHQERVAVDAREDAVARRITELYTKAVEQLGSDKAAVRLGGLYALERLAQDNEDQRQTIVNVLCAYLCMPYQPPETEPLPDEASPDQRLEHRERAQERRVRLTAQLILAAHLAPDDGNRFWRGTDLDLSGALLTDFNLRKCQVRAARFDGAIFTGKAWFDGATFIADVRFDGAIFTGDAWFGGATFTGNAWFGGATFTGDASFGEATFTGNAWFGGATFTGDAWFGGATFTGDASFGEATFTGDTWFGGATFIGDADFNDAAFGVVFFAGARTVATNVRWPPGWTGVADPETADGLRLLRNEAADGPQSVPSAAD